jgi:DNA mismatch repair protein MLH3
MALTMYILGAIKFGDPLSMEECEKLISSLALCNLPFQCAHGRPSVMPLISTEKLSKYVSIVDHMLKGFKDCPQSW